MLLLAESEEPLLIRQPVVKGLPCRVRKSIHLKKPRGLKRESHALTLNVAGASTYLMVPTREAPFMNTLTNVRHCADEQFERKDSTLITNEAGGPNARNDLPAALAPKMCRSNYKGLLPPLAFQENCE